MKLWAIAILILSAPSSSFASGKVDLMAGFFNITAISASGASNALSGPGAYFLAYRMPFWNKFDLQVGYSIDASKGFGGDLEFGPDLGILYFPMTSSDALVASDEAVKMQITERIRPYVGVSFDQRQYQSTQSTYAGFGAGAGCEFNFWSNFSLRADLRYITMAGPASSTANEIDAMIGVTIRAGK